MQGDAIARWVRRHPEGLRLRAQFEASDAAMRHVIERVVAEDPAATPADVRAYIRRARGERA